MKFKKLSDSGSRRLLIIFAGWSMDHKPFSGITLHGHDTAIAFDYTDGASCPVNLTDYDDIKILAWSFGVIAADSFLAANPGLPVSLTVAVNGTLYPVDDRRGIPETIFRGTLEGLSESTLNKFYRRMCGNSVEYNKFMSRKPERAIGSLKEELEMIAGMHPNHRTWDIAVISDNDRIIPAGNQENAWKEEGTRIIRIDGNHLPDFDRIISITMTNKCLVAKRFSEASSTYNANAGIQRDVAEKLSLLWERYQARCVDTVIEIGPGTGLFTEMYSRWLRPSRLELWDLADIPETLPGVHKTCDAERAITSIPDKSIDAIVSASAIQWFDAPKRFIAEAARALRTDGILAISTFGPENFREIRKSYYPSLAEISRWINDSGMEILHAEEYLQTLEFDTPGHLLEHFRSTGVNARGGNRIHEAMRLMRNGINTVTYHPVIVLALNP